MPPKKVVKPPKVVAPLSDSESDNSIDSSGSDSNFESDASDISNVPSDNDDFESPADSMDELADEKEVLELEEKKVEFYEEEEAPPEQAELDDFNSYASRVEERRTIPILSRYERTRAIGVRAAQLASGAKPMVKNTENLAPEVIAELELKSGVCPLYIVRPLPNNQYEVFHINELEILDN